MAGEEAIVHERLASVTSAGAGELAAKFLKDDRTIRREDDKSVTEINFVNVGDEYESIVGWAFQPNNEKSIQSYPSPEFLNSLSFIKKFYPVSFGARGKFIKVTHENSSNLRHSEALLSRKNPADYNLIQLQGISINSTETDHASKPLGIFASKSDVGIAMPTYFDFASKSVSAKKSAFTLAEVLITLGIIGVVAALTIPSIIHKYKSIVLQNQLKKTYSNIQQAVLFMKEDLGIDNLIGEFVHYDADAHAYTNPDLFYKEFDKYMKVQETLKAPYPTTNYSGTQTTASSYGNDLPRALLILPDGSSVGRRINYFSLVFSVDVNGPYKGPNRLGFDIFQFWITDRSDIIKPIKAIRKYADDELDDSSVPWVAGYPCYKDSNQLYNGFGCAWYAVNDINPDDHTKKYWNSLPW